MKKGLFNLYHLNQILFFLGIIAHSLVYADIKINLKGNTYLPNYKLLEVIAPELEEKDEEGRRSWCEDAEFYIADLYRTSGFFEVQAKASLVQSSRDSADWEADISITEGPRYLYDTVKVVVLDTLAKDSLSSKRLLALDLRDLEAQPGKPFQEEALLKDRRYLLRGYGDAGYVRAEVNNKVDIRAGSKTVAVDYLIDASYPVIFDTLLIRNTRAPPADTAAGLTRENLLRSLVPYKRGDTVRISKSDKFIEKLQYTGGFNYVRFKDSLMSDTSQGSVLFLYAEEHVPGNAHGSVFYETQYGPGISADLRHSNLSGTLNEVRTGASFALSRQNGYIGFGSPLPFNLMMRFDNDDDINWYQDRDKHPNQGLFGGDFRATNSSRLTFPLAYWLRLVTNAEVEAKSLMLEKGPRQRDLNMNFIQTAFLSFLNQQMDPTRGFRIALTWGNGGPLVKGDVFDLTEYRHNWLELQTGQYYYFPAYRQVKFATRLDGGRFLGEGGSNSERFFLGGSRSLRSYDFRSFCLEETPGKGCVGLNQTLEYYLASAEVRFEPFDFGLISPRSLWHHLIPIQIVPFIDYAAIRDVGGRLPSTTEENLSQDSKIGVAYGLGIRYPLLGIFNLRMDFAWAPEPQRSLGSKPERFWLDLAQAF
jgi:outer membrane protein assembly factor BamA